MGGCFCSLIFFVKRDLFVQQLQGGLHLGDAGQELFPLVLEDGQARPGGVAALTVQGDVVDQRVDLDPGGAEALHQLDPAAGVLVVIPLAPGVPGHGRDQPDALVVPQGVAGETVFARCFGNGHGTSFLIYCSKVSATFTRLSMMGRCWGHTPSHWPQPRHWLALPPSSA